MVAPFEDLQRALADRYRVERELGRGGMATVLLAEDLRHQRWTAIKVFRPELIALLGPERFLREIAIASKLQHPHILPLLDSGTAAGLLYYVMPYVAGESLRELLDRQQQLAVPDALRLAREVASALDYAHRHGVVHRDIKPENVLLVDDHAVVADFGIARAIDLAAGPQTTATGAVLGTPAYMSPEQASDARHVDGRTDVYSLACTTYEMLAGQPPFTGPTAGAVIYQQLNAEPRPVTTLRPAVPSRIDSALTKALAKVPADRYATAGDFAKALEPTEDARASATGGRRPAWWRLRAAALPALLIVAAIVLPVLLTIFTHWANRSPE